MRLRPADPACRSCIVPPMSRPATRRDSGLKAHGSSQCMRAMGAAAIILCSVSNARAQQNLTLQTVLDRLHAYLVDYAERLPATIATEQYDQRCGGTASRERVSLVSE